ncbi:MAG: PfkB family carbohydrate kinase [Saccharofermentanales bacterium]
MCQVLTYGEILWDIFSDKKVIGGAPLNLAAHLTKLGAKAAIVSALGNDELGEEASEILKSLDLEQTYVMDSHRPTGVCNITLDQYGQPVYDIVSDVAYDHIELNDEIIDAIRRNRYDAFCFGTLASRNVVSRQTLSRILNLVKFKMILYDINIRQNFYDTDIIRDGLRRCSILKVSRDEFGVLNETELIISTLDRVSNAAEYSKACKELSEKYDIDYVLLTLDKEGAFVYKRFGAESYRSEKPKSKPVSTVGAGDSFAACFLYMLLKDQPLKECLDKAVLLSDYVVGFKEAIPAYSDDLVKALEIRRILQNVQK